MESVYYNTTFTPVEESDSNNVVQTSNLEAAYPIWLATDLKITPISHRTHEPLIVKVIDRFYDRAHPSKQRIFLIQYFKEENDQFYEWESWVPLWWLALATQSDIVTAEWRDRQACYKEPNSSFTWINHQEDFSYNLEARSWAEKNLKRNKALRYDVNTKFRLNTDNMLPPFSETFYRYGDPFSDGAKYESRVRIIKTWETKNYLQSISSNQQLMVETPNKQVYTDWKEVFDEAKRNLGYEESEQPQTPKKRRQRNTNTSKHNSQTEVNFGDFGIAPNPNFDLPLQQLPLSYQPNQVPTESDLGLMDESFGLEIDPETEKLLRQLQTNFPNEL